MKSRLFSTLVLVFCLAVMGVTNASSYDTPCFQFNDDLQTVGFLSEVKCVVEFQ